VIFARGPGVPAGGTSKNLSVHDVAPTLLAFLGEPVGKDMAGRPARFLAKPVEFIASYDGIPIERFSTEAPEVEREVLEQLEALGYIEPQ
jgi:arylsulfatase A-like enzyme